MYTRCILGLLYCHVVVAVVKIEKCVCIVSLLEAKFEDCYRFCLYINWLLLNYPPTHSFPMIKTFWAMCY